MRKIGMLNQLRDKIENVLPGDIVRIHGRKIAVADKPQTVAIPYRDEVHSAVEVCGIDTATLRPFLGLAVADQFVTIIR
jgi:hypothetical protein